MATRHPAHAVGLMRTGAIEEGFVADLVLIDSCGDVPLIVKTLVAGHEVFQAPLLAAVAPNSAAKEPLPPAPALAPPLTDEAIHSPRREDMRAP